MVRMGQAAVLAVTMMAAAPVHAAVLDATYRGTLVCDKLPFANIKLREAISVTIDGNEIRYRQVVRLRNGGSEPPETGAGTLSGQHIELKGSWKYEDRKYEAKYSGDFVRRSAKLTGTQTWTSGDLTVTRACAGAIKRPFRIFLGRRRPAAQQ